MNQNNNVIIQAENVKKKFGDFYALKGVSMNVHEGEVVVVLGPSGSGKSTFIRTINQLEKIQKDFIWQGKTSKIKKETFKMNG